MKKMSTAATSLASTTLSNNDNSSDSAQPPSAALQPPLQPPNPANLSSGFSLKMVKQDLFLFKQKLNAKIEATNNTSSNTSNKIALAHCVSADFRMGAGIAVHFRTRYGHMEDLIAQGKRVGECAHLNLPQRFPQRLLSQDEKVKNNNDHIFYLVTKEHYYNKPSYDSLRKSLIDLREMCTRFEIKILLMPKIGCGLDRLAWPQVEKMIREIFSDMWLKIFICYI